MQRRTLLNVATAADSEPVFEFANDYDDLHVWLWCHSELSFCVVYMFLAYMNFNQGVGSNYQPTFDPPEKNNMKCIVAPASNFNIETFDCVGKPSRLSNRVCGGRLRYTFEFITATPPPPPRTVLCAFC